MCVGLIMIRVTLLCVPPVSPVIGEPGVSYGSVLGVIHQSLSSRDAVAYNSPGEQQTVDVKALQPIVIVDVN